MKTIMSALLALSAIVGVTGRANALTADEISPNDTQNFYRQLDREGRGGSGQQ